MQRLWMTTPYRSEPQRYFVQKSSPYKKPSDLDGKRSACATAAPSSSIYGTLEIPGLRLTVDVKNPKIVVYAVEPPGLRASSQARSTPTCGRGRRHGGDPPGRGAAPASGRRLHDVPDRLPRQEFGADPGGVRARIDQIVAKAQRSGALKALSMKYFGKDYGQSGRLQRLAAAPEDPRLRGRPDRRARGPRRWGSSAAA